MPGLMYGPCICISQCIGYVRSGEINGIRYRPDQNEPKSEDESARRVNDGAMKSNYFALVSTLTSLIKTPYPQSQTQLAHHQSRSNVLPRRYLYMRPAPSARSLALSTRYFLYPTRATTSPWFSSRFDKFDQRGQYATMSAQLPKTQRAIRVSRSSLVDPSHVPVKGKGRWKLMM